MTHAQIDRQAAMVGILQAVVDLQAAGADNLTQRLLEAVPDVSPEDFRDLVVMLKNSRCLDATLSDGPDGKKSIESVNGITTRGLRELQKSWQAPPVQHSCPTDGDDGRLGF